MSDLERAIGVALDAHAGQHDKGGEPYILHPLRVMGKMAATEERIVAVLHDVAEDCPDWPVARLADMFGPIIGAALDAITKRKAEPYDVYLDRVAANELARDVKLADIEDNRDFRRLKRRPTAQDLERNERYEKAATRLLNAPPH